MNAEHGMVRIQAQTMLPASPQRTADTDCVAPTPTIEPGMVCVVDTGMPRRVARNSAEPMTKPIAGEMKMNATVFRMPAGISAQVPAFATPAPTRPPISACDDEEGMAYHQVMMFHEIAPTSAPSTT